MRILKLFSRQAPNRVFFAISAGATAGIAYALLIHLLTSAITGPREGLLLVEAQETVIFGLHVAHPKLAASFVVLCFAIVLLRTLSQVTLTRLSMEVTTRIRQDLYTQISRTSISSLEQNGSGRLIQVMTADVQQVVAGARVIPDLLVQMFTLVGLLGFLTYLSPKVFVLVLSMIIIGAITFQVPVAIGARYLGRARLHMDELQDGFCGLTDGAKELKLNLKKSDSYIKSQLIRNEEKAIECDRKGLTIIQVATNYGDMITFFVMGIILFIYTNYNAISTAEITGVIMVLLYITGPVAFILNVFPEVARAKISLDRIQGLFRDLPGEKIDRIVKPVGDWRSIQIRELFYRHPVSGSQFDPAHTGFGIGPIDLDIKRGEITFIVGGNGSGKSTLAKLISLHYFSESGEIAFDGAVVTPLTVHSFRQQVSCIYSDYYLFKQLHSSSSEDAALQREISFYIDRLELKGKVEFRDGHFSTLNLSDGQRRRLALLVALVDDKALYVFDEWAADQDPTFKKIFYFEILPALKNKGKAVVVISHDDRYFEVADNVLVMDAGIIKEMQPKIRPDQKKAVEM